MAVTRKAISQKNLTGHCSGLRFEGCVTKALAEFLVPMKSKISQPLKDQSASQNAIDIALRGMAIPGESLVPLPVPDRYGPGR